MQMRSRAQRYGLRWTGIGLLLAGIALIIIGLAYYGNLYWLRAGVDGYAAQRQDATLLHESASTQDMPNGAIVSAYALPAGAYADTVETAGLYSVESIRCQTAGLTATRRARDCAGIGHQREDEPNQPHRSSHRQPRVRY